MKYFKDLDKSIFKNKVVLLDIDGTITEDKNDFLDLQNENALKDLKQVTEKIVLVSNGSERRTKEISLKYEVDYFFSEYKKPSKGSLPKTGEDFVLVGDKFVTDGLAAIQNKIPFVHAKSIKREGESFKNKFIYFVDDILGKTYEFLRIMRPHHSVKNFLVFAPAFFATEIFNKDILLNSVFAFLAFSFTASFVYVVNDLKDLKNDTLHHKKVWRPLPSQNISKFESKVLGLFLLLLISVLLLSIPKLAAIILIYILANLAYTLKFKNIPIFDVVLVASMYVVRVVAGGVATGLFVSPWIIACTFFASLFLISCKRYVEFQNPTRAVLKRYSLLSLQAMLIISANLSILSYVIYTILGTHIKGAIYTSPFVIAVFLIILNGIFSGEKKWETPETYLFKNKQTLFLLSLWIVTMFLLVYTG